MRITPIDIQQQQFKSRLMGYDKGGVDEFLEVLAGEIERLLRQNQDLQEELAHARSALAEMREREATLKETLLTTQKVTDELKANARREAELLLADAEMRAERVMRNAEDRRLQLIEEIQEIKRQKIDFETSLRSLLEKHVRMLELNSVSISANAEAKLIEEPLPFDRAPSTPETPPSALSGQASAGPAASVPSATASSAVVPPPPSPPQPAARPTAAEADDLIFDIPLISDPGRKPGP